jgi:L-threonylcarbamoyladenylate synthase
VCTDSRSFEGPLAAETVYGLGAHALDEAAVLKIFEYKGRPLTDPLIVHVPSVQAARELLVLDESTARVFDLLASEFWPGPLTLVGPAAASIPPVGE